MKQSFVACFQVDSHQAKVREKAKKEPAKNQGIRKCLLSLSLSLGVNLQLYDYLNRVVHFKLNTETQYLTTN